MTFRFIYCTEPERVIPGVVLDARVPLGIWEQTGFQQQAFFKQQLALITPEVLPYKIEVAENGTCAGYFLLKTRNIGQTAEVLTLSLRPAFQDFTSDIPQKCANFILNGDFRPDLLP